MFLRTDLCHLAGRVGPGGLEEPRGLRLMLLFLSVQRRDRSVTVRVLRLAQEVDFFLLILLLDVRRSTRRLTLGDTSLPGRFDVYF